MPLWEADVFTTPRALRRAVVLALRRGDYPEEIQEALPSMAKDVRVPVEEVEKAFKRACALYERRFGPIPNRKTKAVA